MKGHHGPDKSLHTVDDRIIWGDMPISFAGKMVKDQGHSNVAMGREMGHYF